MDNCFSTERAQQQTETRESEKGAEGGTAARLYCTRPSRQLFTSPPPSPPQFVQEVLYTVQYMEGGCILLCCILSVPDTYKLNNGLINQHISIFNSLSAIHFSVNYSTTPIRKCIYALVFKQPSLPNIHKNANQKRNALYIQERRSLPVF
jgi:hypothetical protein